jgi:hypothetical protein
MIVYILILKSNSTLARNREPDRRYAISSPTSAEERKLDCRLNICRMFVYILILDLNPVFKTHTHKTMIVNART